ncbi:hypothetical protein ACMUWU_002125 [Enterococcus faecalis]
MMNQNNQKINVSSTRFKKVANSGKPKGKFLANWLLTKSYHLEKEVDQSQASFFNKYKKGTVVMIDFGVNIGNELSNHHLAIVLNKEDNIKNGVLTVLPLSSKPNKHYLKLDDELFKTIINDLYEKQSDIDKELSELDFIVDETADIANGDEKTVTIITENKKKEVTSEVDAILDYLKKKLAFLKDKNEKISALITRYSKYNNDSYVCMKSIQTISKCRIITLNEYDPSGTIRLSKNTMDKIDRELVTVFTNIKI